MRNTGDIGEIKKPRPALDGVDRPKQFVDRVETKFLLQTRKCLFEIIQAVAHLAQETSEYIVLTQRGLQSGYSVFG